MQLKSKKFRHCTVLAHTVFRCYDQLLDAGKDENKVQPIFHTQMVRGFCNVQDIRMLY
jgi:hypothetical protein